MDPSRPSAEALTRVLQLCDNNQSELARRLGGTIKQSYVWKWIRAGKVPAERVPAVCKAVGNQVLPHELRPDLPDVFPIPDSLSEAA